MGVGGNVHGEHWQLVAVQAQEELQAVSEENLDRAVQQCNSQQLACTIESGRESAPAKLAQPGYLLALEASQSSFQRLHCHTHMVCDQPHH